MLDTVKNLNFNVIPFKFQEITSTDCISLSMKYHSNEERILKAAKELSPEAFLRLFITFHGMRPVGRWQSHTYVRVTDSFSKEDHFFLIPIPRKNDGLLFPDIRIENDRVWVDDLETSIFPQSIPYTTPFWYFHYNPNTEDRPFSSMTLNLSPSCSEKCTLCAGAKTGRVNNGMDETLPVQSFIDGVFHQLPEAKEQLDNVAIVTGCFDDFDELYRHLKGIQKSVKKYATPQSYCVLEHNITTEREYDLVVGELGYDVYITLECFDQEMRNIALNGRVGRKGRDSKEFIEMAKVYAQYLDKRPHLEKNLVRITYLVGIDSLEVTKYFFKQLAEINKTLKNTKIIPWMSVFTPYNDAMRVIQRKDYSLSFLYQVMDMSEKYFGKELMMNESGGTNHGYARGLY